MMTASFVWHSEQLSYDRNDIEQQKAIVRNTFADMGWGTSRALEAMDGVEWMYFDSVSQVHLKRVVDGRVGLLGDAGYGATMGGLGTGLAVVGAYVLASELALSRPDLVAGLREYERVIDAYAKGGQKLARGAGPLPRSADGVAALAGGHHLLGPGPAPVRPDAERDDHQGGPGDPAQALPSLIAARAGDDVSTRH